MIDYGRLVESLRACGTEDGVVQCTKCHEEFTPGCSCSSALYRKAADAIEELWLTAESNRRSMEAWADEAANRWISVDDRLPEKNGKVLVAYDGFSGRFKGTGVFWFANNLEAVDECDFEGERRPGFYDYCSESGSYEKSGVRYWMPLPEWPKEE